MGLTYRDTGVDIEKGEHFVEVIKKKLKKDEQSNIGLFGGLFELEIGGYTNPVLVSSTDGVGTKLLLAKQAQIYSTIGIDLVAMCVNDIITLGAKPLFFLDYMATAKLKIKEASEVIDGIIEGCRQGECALLGGETAEMPGVYSVGDYELAGFAVGIVEKCKIIDGTFIRAGDLLVGIKSSGVHSNGLSLARRALFEEKKYSYNEQLPLLEKPLIEELLTPTRVYVRAVIEILKKVTVKGISHITGGGIEGNVKRLLPAGLDVEIFWDEIPSLTIFRIIAESANIRKDEMRKTFNLGIGLVFIIGANDKKQLISHLTSIGEEPKIIGEVISM